jgi:hypothetical protein
MISTSINYHIFIIDLRNFYFLTILSFFMFCLMKNLKDLKSLSLIREIFSYMGFCNLMT